VILTEPHLQTSDNMTEKQIRKIERRNRRIDAQNEFLVSSIKNGLREYYDDLHNSEGILIDFVFNYITVDDDGQNLRSLYRLGVMAGIGHTFGLHHPSNGGVGIMAYPPEHLLPSQVDAIWSNSFEVR
jgi:hypothetical protein